MRDAEGALGMAVPFSSQPRDTRWISEIESLADEPVARADAQKRERGERKDLSFHVIGTDDNFLKFEKHPI
jgi:hypothetical protein